MATAAVGKGKGKEGDWDCSGCRNRNYAFRSFCNRCKQPRLLVDANTPAHSKWLPRIGDWICTGCSNNNYASREKCKKCGQSKEEAAMPAIAMPGPTLPAYAHYFAMLQGLYGSPMNSALNGDPAIQSLLPSSSWSFGGKSKHGMEMALSYPLSQNIRGDYSFTSNTNQILPAPKGWRNGDWICDCGYHNYSSRSECKKCNAPLASGAPSAATSTVSDMFSTLGTKRLASEEFAAVWDNKRLNAGDVNNTFLTNGYRSSYQDFEQPEGYNYDEVAEKNADFSIGSMQVNMHPSQQRTMPTLIGKGAKQWRDGDWMCNNCNNHNFASRSICNRCKTQKEAAILPVSVA
ncbi:nuclear pore complex protein [Canna indica]|uniref:Nuclear pore complex protein n=1 Tax=Canna indica TaxID=4628 RepID=A0AAQ3Q1X5_9LILI|nr:nuclear pore complex protein [Canna indica]